MIIEASHQISHIRLPTLSQLIFLWAFTSTCKHLNQTLHPVQTGWREPAADSDLKPLSSRVMMCVISFRQQLYRRVKSITLSHFIWPKRRAGQRHLPLSKWRKAADVIKPARKSAEVALQESMVWVKSLKRLFLSGEVQPDAHAGDRLAWLAACLAGRSLGKSRFQKKKVSERHGRYFSYNTTLTPRRREQIVETRDPISKPCDRK